jgi:nucleotide-binding universal stress UspA family protein
MADSFKNILIPVDFSVNTEVAVKKALEMADKNANLHLLHIKKWQLLKLGGLIGGKIGVERNHLSIEKKLGEWKCTIEDSNESIKVNIWVFDGGTVQDGIEKKAAQLAVDLIVLGKNAYHPRLPFLNTVVPNELASYTGIPVLTVKPGSMHNKIRKVVLPISYTPVFEKLDVISMLCRKYQVKIYLVTFNVESREASEQNISSLLKVYQSLKTLVNCEVEYGVLNGHNIGMTILNFALQINADILLVEPKTETRTSWWNGHISDMLPYKSKIGVLNIGSMKGKM